MARSNRSILLLTSSSSGSSSEYGSLRRVLLLRSPSPLRFIFFIVFIFIDFIEEEGAAESMEMDEGSDGMDRVSVDVVTVGVDIDIADKLGSELIPEFDSCHRGANLGEHGGGDGGGFESAPF